MPARCVEQALFAHPHRGRRRRVGLFADRHVALQRPDHGDVELVVGLALELHRLAGLRGLRERLGVPLHLQVHPDLEQLQRRQLAHRLRARLPCEHLQRAFQPKRRVRLGGDREPQVELVVAQVVVRDARVGVDHLRRPMGVLGVDLRGHQHRGVAERARVEDRRHLADDPLLQQARARAPSPPPPPSSRAPPPARKAGGRSGSCPASGSAGAGRRRPGRPRRRACVRAASESRSSRSLRSSPSGGVLCVVGDDHVGARTVQRGQDLRTAARSSSCPAGAAAFTIAYSPLTL